PEQCNQLGLELAEKIAPNHQVAVYTHADTNHVHNHIVINSIDLETGKKYQSNKKQREFVKQKNDEVCREHGLSVTERNATMRYTQAEKGLIEKGKSSWKDEIRDAIEQSQATNFEELERELNQLDITIDRVTNKTITYRHLKENKKVRGKNLGEQFDKGALENEFAIANERREFEQQLSEYEPRESEYRPRDTEKNIKRPKELRVQSRENDFELE
ncbi:relaxase/mobilization nuclease domain-containing protein, partial [Staphylococcus epidermidis]